MALKKSVTLPTLSDPEDFDGSKMITSSFFILTLIFQKSLLCYSGMICLYAVYGLFLSESNCSKLLAFDSTCNTGSKCYSATVDKRQRTVAKSKLVFMCYVPPPPPFRTSTTLIKFCLGLPSQQAAMSRTSVLKNTCDICEGFAYRLHPPSVQSLHNGLDRTKTPTGRWFTVRSVFSITFTFQQLPFSE